MGLFELEMLHGHKGAIAAVGDIDAIIAEDLLKALVKGLWQVGLRLG